MSLTPIQLTRYNRHLIMPEIGMEGQERLLASSVLLIGMGGLGSPLGLYLAAAGVGKLGILDFDRVDLTNLQRQILYTTGDVGREKTEAAESRIRALNPDVAIVRHGERLSSENALEILRPYDVVVDGTDNFPTRYLVNDACVLLKKPNIYGSIFRFEGQVTVFHPGKGPCYRCLFPEPPPPGSVPSCAEGGVLGILPGVVGTLQATEAIKVLTGKGETLVGRLLHYDALAMKFREFRIRRDPACPICGDRPTISRLVDYEAFCGIRGVPAPGAAAAAADGNQISAADVKGKMDRGEDFVLVDVREPWEHQAARIPGSVLIPLGQIEQRLAEFEPHRGREIVLHCHKGTRSLRAFTLLKSKGFVSLKNLAGGIDAWSQQVDRSVPRY